MNLKLRRDLGKFSLIFHPLGSLNDVSLELKEWEMTKSLFKICIKILITVITTEVTTYWVW